MLETTTQGQLSVGWHQAGFVSMCFHCVFAVRVMGWCWGRGRQILAYSSWAKASFHLKLEKNLSSSRPEHIFHFFSVSFAK